MRCVMKRKRVCKTETEEESRKLTLEVSCFGTPGEEHGFVRHDFHNWKDLAVINTNNINVQ